MPRDGNGTFSLPAGNPVVTGTTISSTVQNNTMNDVAAALTGSIASDGQTTPTADLKMGGFKHKNVANASSRISTNASYASAADVQDGTITFLTGTAGTNTVTASAPLGLVAYVTGQKFSFIPAATNTGATTLSINSIGAKNIFLNGVALAGGELLIAAPVEVIYDGTQFHIIGNSAFVAVTDSSAIVKGSADATKKVRLEVDGLTTGTTRVLTPPDRDITLSGITLATPQASTSGTAIDFTGIPAGVKRITVMLAGVSTNSTSPLTLLIGDSGGIETTGYSSGVGGGNAYSVSRSSIAFLLTYQMIAAGAYSGSAILSLENSANNTWALQGIVTRTDAVTVESFFSGGSKATSAVLDRLRISTSSGDTFDGGEINISYE